MPYRLSKFRIAGIFILFFALSTLLSWARSHLFSFTRGRMVTKRHLRIAVLECDEPVGKTKEKYGGYGNLFKELLENGVEEYPGLYGEKAPELEVTKFDVVNTDNYPRLEDVDAVLLTGSSRFCS